MENTTTECFNRGEESIDLPPGFRFHPTDEELITHYLLNKVMDKNFGAIAIGEADFNKCEPWDLPCRAKIGEKSWYFFCVKDRKYPTGLRTNRATRAGYWKATGKDKEIYKGKTLIGMKKTLVFYTGRAPKGTKSNWVMHEFRLEGKFSPYSLPKAPKSEWVICRVFKKALDAKKPINELGSSLPPPLMDVYSSSDLAQANHVTCFSNATMATQRGGHEHEELFSDYFTNPSMQPMNPQIDHNILSLIYPNSSFMQLIGAKESFNKTEFLSGSQETGHANDMNHEISSVVSLGTSH